MFGSLRFVLAYLVIISHLSGSVYAQHFGYYAVQGFFVISGFVITSALHEVYGFDGARFWTNRLLRLLPLYYVICVLTFSVIIIFPVESAQYLPFWRHDGPVISWIPDGVMNVLVIPLQFHEPRFRMVPPYWSIAIEIEMYLLLFLVAARNSRFAIAVLVVGVSFHILDEQLGFDWNTRYFTAAGAIMPFAIGSIIYFWRRDGVLQVTAGQTVHALVIWFANMVVAGWAMPESYVFGLGYYLNSVVFAIAVAGLAQQRVGPLLSRVDRALGEIAYPVFLSQWLVGFIVAMILFPGNWRGWVLTLAATPCIIAAGIALASLSRCIIEPLRARVKVDASGRRLRPAPAMPANSRITV